MANLGLADPVETAEALFDPVGVPGQVVIDHQMRTLQVDALAGGVGGQQHLYFGVVLEQFLGLEALFASDATVDDDDRLLAAEQRADALFEVVERVAVLGEDDQLLVRRRGGWRDRTGTIGSRRFGNAVATLPEAVL